MNHLRTGATAVALITMLGLSACSSQTPAPSPAPPNAPESSVTAQESPTPTPSKIIIRNQAPANLGSADGKYRPVPFTPDQVVYPDENMEVLGTELLSAWEPNIYIKQSYGEMKDGHAPTLYHFQLNDHGEEQVIEKQYVTFQRYMPEIEAPSVTLFKLADEGDTIHATFILPEDSLVLTDK